MPAGGPVDALGGAKPWSGVWLWGGIWVWGSASWDGVEVVAGAGVADCATWLPRDAPKAKPAVSAAAPAAAQPVMVRTRRRASVLSIAMRAGSTAAVSDSEALSKRFVGSAGDP
jgi:hypothetical protein